MNTHSIVTAMLMTATTHTAAMIAITPILKLSPPPPPVGELGDSEGDSTAVGGGAVAPRNNAQVLII